MVTSLLSHKKTITLSAFRICQSQYKGYNVNTTGDVFCKLLNLTCNLITVLLVFMLSYFAEFTSRHTDASLRVCCHDK